MGDLIESQLRIGVNEDEVRAVLRAMKDQGAIDPFAVRDGLSDVYTVTYMCKRPELSLDIDALAAAAPSLRTP